MLDFDEAIRATINTSWQYWHGRETVTLSVHTDAGETLYVVDDCKRFDVTKSDIPGQKQGAIVGADIEWLIPFEKLDDGILPKISDAIIPASGDEFVVQSVNQNGWRNWYKLTCRDISLTPGLVDTITLQRPHYVNTGGVREVLGYSALYSVTGKVIEIASEYSPGLLGKRQAKQTFEVHTSRAVRWTPGDRIGDAKGNIYQITGSQPPSIIDALNILNCERIA